MRAAARGDIAAALSELRDQYDSGADPAVILTDLAEFTHFVTRVKIVPAVADDAALIDGSAGDVGKVLAELRAAEAGAVGGSIEDYDPKGELELSDTAYAYIAGLMEHLPAITAVANPIVNSYKRLVPGYEAPVNLVYSQRNRSAAVRIPLYSKSPKAKRIESSTTTNRRSGHRLGGLRRGHGCPPPRLQRSNIRD